MTWIKRVRIEYASHERQAGECAPIIAIDGSCVVSALCGYVCRCGGCVCRLLRTRGRSAPTRASGGRLEMERRAFHFWDGRV